MILRTSAVRCYAAARDLNPVIDTLERSGKNNMIKRLTNSLLTLALVAGLAAGAQAQSSADIHGDPGCAPSAFAGNLVTLTGIVYVVAGVYNAGSWYIQDTSGGGMTFFDSSFAGAINEGDLIEATGTVDAFGTEIQLIGTTVNILSSGNVATPVAFGTADLADGTDQLGNLVEVTGLLALVSSGFNSTYTIDDGSGPVICFVDGTTGIDQALLDSYVGDIVRVRGSSKCFNGEGEVLPRRDSDIELITVSNDDASFGSLKANFDR